MTALGLTALTARLETLDLRLHVNRSRGVCVLAWAGDARHVSSDQWWRWGLTETEALRLLWGPERHRRAYLRAAWPWPHHAPAQAAPGLSPEPPPGDLKGHCSDAPDDAPRDWEASGVPRRARRGRLMKQ